MSRDVIQQLKALKHADINPSPEWLENNRALLLSQIKNTIRAEKKSFATSFIHRIEEVFLHSSNRLVQVGVAVVLIAIVGVTGQVATSQAAQALPGDTLYGLKRTTENTKLAIASVVADQNQLVKLHLDLAAVRADEVKQVLTKKPERKAAAQAAVKDLQQELQTANQKLDTLKQQAPNNVKDTVMNVQVTTNAIKDTLQDVKDNLQTSTSSVDKNLSQDLATAKQLVNDTNVVTVQVAVANHMQGGDVTKDDVTKVVDNTLQSVAADTTQSKQIVTDAKNVVTQLSSATSTLPASSTITTTSIKLASTETTNAAEQTLAAGQQIDQKITEVKQLVEQGGDLTQIVDKVKAVSNASTAVEKLSDKTLQNIQTLLPQVQLLKNNESTSSSILSTSTNSTTSTTSTVSTSTFKNTTSTPTSTLNATTSTGTSSLKRSSSTKL